MTPLKLQAAFVQGASRGIGLQFCRVLLSRGVPHVLASCRHPERATALADLQRNSGDRLTVLQVDCMKEQSVVDAARAAAVAVERLDLLVNCAGMLHPSGRGETSLKDVSQAGLSETFLTNAVGPLLMAKHLSSLLLKGKIEQKDYVSIIANISAKVGSITENGLGGWYSYRMSKSAVNMATKNLAIELGRGKRKVLCLSLHPGTVDTDLSRPYHRNVPAGNLFSVEHSVERMVDVIEKAKYEDSGKFFNHDGSIISF